MRLWIFFVICIFILLSLRSIANKKADIANAGLVYILSTNFKSFLILTNKNI